MPTRLLIAYLLIALMGAGVLAAVWWNVHHSRHRTEARRRTRQRAVDAARLAATQSKDDHG